MTSTSSTKDSLKQHDTTLPILLPLLLNGFIGMSSETALAEGEVY